MINGLRALRTMSLNSTLNEQALYSDSYNQTKYLVIVIVGAVVTLFSFGIVAYQVWVIEHNKAEILSLYALLGMQEINDVYGTCDRYMSRLNLNSIVKTLVSSNKREGEDGEDDEDEDQYEEVLSQQTSLYDASGTKKLG